MEVNGVVIGKSNSESSPFGGWLPGEKTARGMTGHKGLVRGVPGEGRHWIAGLGHCQRFRGLERVPEGDAPIQATCSKESAPVLEGKSRHRFRMGREHPRPLARWTTP